VGILRVLLETTYAELARRIWRALAAVAAMSGVLVVLESYLPAASAGEGIAALVLLAKAVVGAATYAGVRLLIWKATGRPEFTETTAMTALAAAATRFRALR
jgi:hypothetical protein